MRVRHDILDISPFIVLYDYDSAMPWDVEDDAPKREAPAARERVKEILVIREQLDIRLKQTRETQKKYYNKKYKPIQYQLGDLIILLNRNIIIKRPSKKLDAKFLGSFKIVETKGKQVYKLDLSQIYSRIYNVFHVSLLEPYKQRLNNILLKLTPIKRQMEH